MTTCVTRRHALIETDLNYIWWSRSEYAAAPEQERQWRVTLPKDDLDRDNALTDDGEIPESQSVFVERADEGVYVVRLCDGGDVPELETTNLVERLAAKRAQEMMSQTNQSPLKTAD